MIDISESENLGTSIRVLDLGKRKVSRMNFSFIVTLPKAFVQDTKKGSIVKAVRMVMLEDGSLKLTPVCEKSEPAEFSVM